MDIASVAIAATISIARIFLVGVGVMVMIVNAREARRLRDQSLLDTDWIAMSERFQETGKAFASLQPSFEKLADSMQKFGAALDEHAENARKENNRRARTGQRP